METKKYITASFLIFCFAITFSACKEHCRKNHPKDVKPIDWGNYNDVYTVYWNCYSCCDEINENEGRTVKMSGWKAWSDKAFLCDDAKYADKELGSAAYPCIAIECDLPEFQAKLDSCDLTKKCFVEGKIFLRKVKYPSGCAAKPIIKITNIDDIYFEK